MTWKMLACTGLILALAGCQTPQERRAGFIQECQALGTSQGSPQFVQCVTQLETLDLQRRIAISQALASGAAAYTPPAPQPPPVFAPPVRCTSVPAGNSVVTNCF